MPLVADPEALARRVALQRYGMEGRIRRLDGFEDLNFRIDAGERSYVLKLVPPGVDAAYVQFQVALLRHLNERTAAKPQPFLLPRIVDSVDGEALVSVDGDDGEPRLARLVTWVPGDLYSQVNPKSPALLRSLGAVLGAVDGLLAGFVHPAAERDEPWDLALAADSLPNAGLIDDDKIRGLVVGRLERFVRDYETARGRLPRSVIHNDANDNNVVVSAVGEGPRRVSGLIDFGDAVLTARVFEAAIACAYAMLGRRDALAAACSVVRGYCSETQLHESEIALLFPAICARLAVSAATAARSRRDNPANDYLQVSDADVREMLLRLDGVDEAWAEVRLRQAAGFEPCSRSPEVRLAMAAASGVVAPIFGDGVDVGAHMVHDLSVGGSRHAPWDLTTSEWTARLARERKAAGVAVGIGRYGEHRLAYTSDRFRIEDSDAEERRTLHLGVDLFAHAGTPVHAPIDGVVYSVADNGQDLDYGPTVILRHAVANPTGGDTTFFSLYGHLAPDVLRRWKPGDRVPAGELLAHLGDEEINGGWPPHLHFQVMTRMFGRSGDFPGVAPAAEAESWLSVCPNPATLLGLSEDLTRAPELRANDIRAARAVHLGPSLSLAYSESDSGPLHIVRGRGTYLYASDGRAYLDCVNNVCHVGHAHPRVVAAIARQSGILNTNTRYLHEHIVEYATRLAATLPEPLTVVYLVCSGSEANDLAIRLARAATGRRGIAVVDNAYHGNLTSLIEISPYKFAGRGGEGQPGHVAVVPMPDVYRGRFGADPGAYVEAAKRELATLASSEHGLAAFFAESLLSCGGQIELPPNYLTEVYSAVRRLGGVCVADEVQVGFGRVGSHFWGFETQGIVPDIVTMGKPIGNGHPLAAVVTTPAIATAFATGMEYFNTYGGNPVSCAAGLAVLDVIEEEDLQARAADVGGYLLDGLRVLQQRHEVVGDVRGRGLFLGFELVENRETKGPAARQATALVNRVRDRGILLSTDGPDHNVIKIKPPLVFARTEADRLFAVLDEVLAEDEVRA